MKCPGIVEIRRSRLGPLGGEIPPRSQKRDLHPTDKDPSVGARTWGTQGCGDCKRCGPDLPPESWRISLGRSREAVGG